MRIRRTPFYGDAMDRELLGPSFKLLAVDEMTDVPPAALELVEQAPVTVEVDAARGYERKSHPDYREKGTELALGFMPHDGENRKPRRAAVSTWAPPEPTAEQLEIRRKLPHAPETGVKMPTRRELWEQRKKHRRGTLDTELRRLQRERLKTK